MTSPARSCPAAVLLSLAVVGLASSAPAQAAGDPTDLESGELDSTAHTLRQGEHQIHLNTTYKYGIVDGFQIGTNVGTWFLVAPEINPDAAGDYSEEKISGWMLAGAANLQMEGTVWDNENMALSVGTNAQVFYQFGNPYVVYLNAIYTYGSARSNRLNVGLSYGYRADSFDWNSSGEVDEWEQQTYSELPIEISYDYQLSDTSMVRALFRTDPLSFGRTTAIATQTGAETDESAGWITTYVAYHKSWAVYRLALGMMLTSRGMGDARVITELLNDYDNAPSYDPPKYQPLPYVRMWWKF
jgi:hypothetical protein